MSNSRKWPILQPLLIVLTVASCDIFAPDTTPPDPSVLSVEFRDSSFLISWDKSNDDDFHSYTLYESSNDSMDGRTEIAQIDVISDVTFTIRNVRINTEIFYQLVTSDEDGNNSKSNIAIGQGDLIGRWHSYYHSEYFEGTFFGDSVLWVMGESYFTDMRVIIEFSGSTIQASNIWGIGGGWFGDPEVPANYTIEGDTLLIIKSIAGTPIFNFQLNGDAITLSFTYPYRTEPETIGEYTNTYIYHRYEGVFPPTEWNR